jgi:transposase
MSKATRTKYTLEFKQEAVKLVKSGMTLAQAARQLGMADQTLHAWVKADAAGKLYGAGDTRKNLVSAEQMELTRLRKELERVKMERDIRRKATAYFAKESL